MVATIKSKKLFKIFLLLTSLVNTQIFAVDPIESLKYATVRAGHDVDNQLLRTGMLKNAFLDAKTAIVTFTHGPVNHPMQDIPCKESLERLKSLVGAKDEAFRVFMEASDELHRLNIVYTTAKETTEFAVINSGRAVERIALTSWLKELISARTLFRLSVVGMSLDFTANTLVNTASAEEIPSREVQIERMNSFILAFKEFEAYMYRRYGSDLVCNQCGDPVQYARDIEKYKKDSIKYEPEQTIYGLIIQDDGDRADLRDKFVEIMDEQIDEDVTTANSGTCSSDEPTDESSIEVIVDQSLEQGESTTDTTEEQQEYVEEVQPDNTEVQQEDVVEVQYEEWQEIVPEN